MIAGSQTPISGVKNIYTKVVSRDAPDQISVNNITGFAVGDTVLIIQMKGAEVLTVNDNTFGNVQEVYTTGNYEFLIVSGISGMQLTFTADLISDYDPAGDVQLIKVPSYESVIVNGILSCDPWDPASGTGGVLALIVDRMIKLEADIDVSGKGFTGGQVYDGNGICSKTDSSAYDSVYFNIYSLKGANKGEGSATFGPGKVPLGTTDYARGKGKLFQGGGGGNGQQSGGGGGANYGSGGKGAPEACWTLGDPDMGGVGGYSMISTPWVADARIFMGGGGGAGTQSSGGGATPGTSGGGIVIIIADSIVVDNGTSSIRSNGLDGPQTGSGSEASNGGGGGAGAGGSLILDIDNIGDAGTLELAVKGGDGTDVTGAVGPGGGGGGGLIWYSDVTEINKTNRILTKGLAGTGGGSRWPDDGEPGADSSGLIIPLNGFLYNIISSANTYAYTDTICEGDLSPLLLGSLPKGGTPPYQYQWESRTDETAWAIEQPYGVGGVNYQPLTPLTDTTYYRRLVMDSSMPPVTDLGKQVTIIVQPKIENNILSTVPDTVCSLIQPDTIFCTPKLPTGGNGPGSYTYLWQESPDGVSSWINTANTGDKEYYLPPVMDVTLITDVYFRRIVFSGIGCPDTSASAKLVYLPKLENRIFYNQEICDNTAPGVISTDPPDGLGGGTGSYKFNWYESTDGSDITGPALETTQAYNPPVLFHGTASDKLWYYRREVISGVCKDTSNYVRITVHPLISNNNILNYADTIICKGINPAPLNASVPPVLAGGDGTYTYKWLESVDDILFTPVAGATNAGYSPGALNDTTYFRREVISTFDPANNTCKDTSATVTINTHPTYTAGLADLAAGRDTVCYGNSGQIRLSLIESVAGYNGPWNIIIKDSDDNEWPHPNQAGSGDITVSANHDFSGADETEKIDYTIVSVRDKNGCGQDPDVPLTPGSIVVVRPPHADAGTDRSVCGLAENLQATRDFGTGLWSGPARLTLTSPSNENTLATADTQGVYILTWTASNYPGICADATDDVQYTFWDEPSEAIIGPDVTDTTLAAFIRDISLATQGYVVGDINWSFNSGGGSFSDKHGATTNAQGMDIGENEIQLLISSGGGDCPEFDKTDIIRVRVQEEPFIQKGMSPGFADGINDYFYIENIGNVKNELVVFNKLGIIIYQADNYACDKESGDNCWDGRDKNGNLLPDGTYYYVLKILGERPRTLTGYFVIKGS